MEEKKVCANCGEVVEELITIFIDGEEKEVCSECAEEFGYAQCPVCGEWSHTDDMSIVDEWTTSERWVCESCLDEHFYYCEDCHGWFSRPNVVVDDYGTVICGSCFDNGYYHRCETCGRILAEDEGVYDEDEDEWYCDGCYETHSIHGYSYKPEPEFRFTNDERDRSLCTGRVGLMLEDYLVFGVEDEVDNGRNGKDLATALDRLHLPIYCKHDGSLGDEGVEIVTHPGSLAYHMTGMGWDKIVSTCTHHGFRSHDTSTCGLHIHIGRQGMGRNEEVQENTIASLVILVDSLWDDLVKFSRRRESALDHWAQRPVLRETVWKGPRWNPVKVDLDLSTDEGLKESALATERDGRYQAVNLCNSETVEIRIFRGTLKRDTLIASLQLVNNLVKYAMGHTPLECKSATFTDIVRVEGFAELNAYCADKGLI